MRRLIYSYKYEKFLCYSLKLITFVFYENKFVKNIFKTNQILISHYFIIRYNSQTILNSINMNCIQTS